MGAVATRHVERGIAGTEALGRLVSALREHRIILWSQMNIASPDEESALATRYRKNRAEIAGAIRDYEPLAGEFTPGLKAIADDVEALDDANARILEVQGRGDVAAALGLMKGEGRDASNRTIHDAERLIENQKARAARSNEAGQAFATTAFFALLLLSTIALAVLGAIWWLIGTTVSKPMARLSLATRTLADGGEAEVPYRERQDELGEVAGAVEQFRVAAVQRLEADARLAREQNLVTSSLGEGLAALSNGDLSTEITVEYRAGYGVLKSNFNDAVAGLRTLVGAVLRATSAIQTGSREIAQASEDLARRTESGAASLEETTAAITEMDTRLQATAGAATTTVQRADQTLATVAQGRGIADEAVQAMNRVSESAKGIDSVIEGLDKIAFQTRVLAMNAAVEAGRAGDAGRGFAVVADLVSALAMRAEEEAGRAREQLTTTQADIVTAVGHVEKVDGALLDISSDVGEVHGLLTQIAVDNKAQSVAVTQINSAVGGLDQSTQQNAAMVEETSAAARSLTSEVSALAEQATRFKIGDGAPAGRAKPAERAPAAKRQAPAARRPAAMAGAAAEWATF
jgi:methyl-accepting chemotaxis protein